MADESTASSQVAKAGENDVITKDDSKAVVLTAWHYFFMLVACLTILGITVYPKELEPIIGHPASLSLCIVVMTFGSGFMSREEFLGLDWDLMVLVGGTNVMAFLVRETGLGATLSAKIVGADAFTSLPYWGMLAILIVSTVIVSTCFGHSLSGVLLLPLIVAVGVKLQAAETTAILCAIAIPFGMGMIHSSFDNLAAYNASKGIGKRDKELTQRDFRIAGGPLTVLAAFLVLVLGFGVCVNSYGLPPPVVVSETGTPEKLKPRVAKENLPREAKQVAYNDEMADWKDFERRPEKKAFAVGEFKEGMKTRAWAAAWGHPTQESANKAAIRDCERMAKRCRLIYPPKDGEKIRPPPPRAAASFLAQGAVLRSNETAARLWGRGWQGTALRVDSP